MFLSVFFTGGIFFCPIRTCAWSNILGIGVVLANNVPLKWFLNIGDSVGISERNYCHIYYVKLPNNMNTVQKKKQAKIITCLDKKYEECYVERKVGNDHNLSC